MKLSIFGPVITVVAALLLVVVPITNANATSGPGCLRVVNVPAGDVLNVRAGASANSAIVDRIDPNRQGILALRSQCVPLSRPWGSRWCPVTHYNGNAVVDGYVKARYIRDQECP
ncbi:MAG: SH3 domain-containing protein [Pseudomonadota bacterium]